MGRELPDTRTESRTQAPEPNWAEGNVINPFLNGLVVTPYNAAANAVNFVTGSEIVPKAGTLKVAEPDAMSGDWFVQNIAGGLGAIGPYVVAGKVAGAGMRGIGGKMAAESSAAAFMKSDIAAQVVGAAALDYARDTREGETRFGNALGGAAAFYVFGKGNTLAQTENFWLRQGARAGTGALGGMAGLTAAGLVSGHGLPEWKTLGEAAVAGGTMNLVMPPLQKALTPSEIRSAYYDMKWKGREAYTEGRRTAYQWLNKADMRHPIDKLTGRMSGDDAVHLTQRVPLTNENNPIRAFERETPEFIRTIKERERLMEATADRRESYEIYDSMKEVRIAYGEKLLEIWHGTPTRPGMKAYSDAELATTAGVSLERVAQIRQTLTAGLDARYGEISPFSNNLRKLFGEDTDIHTRHDDHLNLNELEASRERFWGYNDRDLSRKLSLGDIFHAMDRHPNTPADWMPFEQAPGLSNLFHGTTSPALNSIIAERAMLPAWELRLRGIKHNTGESANEEFARRAISMTRNFGVAFSYHRHNPRISDFPMVMGISADVVPRSRSAGFLEPGETLMSSLRFGDGWFGWKKSDIQNIYVPNAEVTNVAQQLARRGIRGVGVVGFNDIPAPNWKPKPTPEQLREWYPFG
jgi:hypothetical protein